MLSISLYLSILSWVCKDSTNADNNSGYDLLFMGANILPNIGVASFTMLIF